MWASESIWDTAKVMQTIVDSGRMLPKEKEDVLLAN